MIEIDPKKLFYYRYQLYDSFALSRDYEELILFYRFNLTTISKHHIVIYIFILRFYCFITK